uniref:C-type lectin domain-containing protein n=1 Tax=Oryzias melastigma TaxID=30732 RepID=A0A3B3BIN7_ORYME
MGLLCLIVFLTPFLTHQMCQPGWRQNDGKCYFFSTDTKSWFDANNYCMEQNSHLLSIQDEEFSLTVPPCFLFQLWVRTQIGTEIYWMGLNDEIVEGVWEWSDGSPFIEYLSLWGQGQPDNWQGNEHCGEVVGYNNGHWNDENCDSKRRYICKHINCK